MQKVVLEEKSSSHLVDVKRDWLRGVLDDDVGVVKTDESLRQVARRFLLHARHFRFVRARLKHADRWRSLARRRLEFFRVLFIECFRRGLPQLCRPALGVLRERATWSGFLFRLCVCFCWSLFDCWLARVNLLLLMRPLLWLQMLRLL